MKKLNHILFVACRRIYKQEFHTEKAAELIKKESHYRGIER
jgi:hypothetical protein